MELVELITLTVNISDVKDKICVVGSLESSSRLDLGLVYSLFHQIVGVTLFPICLVAL